MSLLLDMVGLRCNNDSFNALAGLYGLVIFVTCAIGDEMMMEVMVLLPLISFFEIFVYSLNVFPARSRSSFLCLLFGFH